MDCKNKGMMDYWIMAFNQSDKFNCSIIHCSMGKIKAERSKLIAGQ